MPAVDVLRDWRQLGRSLELAQGFAYYLVFTNWPEQNQAGKALLNEALQTRGLSLQVVVPNDPARLVEDAIAALFHPDLLPDLPPNSPLWLECWRNGSDPDWNLARRRLMARLNEGRGRLEKEVLRPLILLLPRYGVLRAAEDAPDMWSIRKLVVHLERPAVSAVALESFPKFAEPPTPELLARAERRLAVWRKQWAKAEAAGDMHVLSLPDAGDAFDALLETGRLQDAKTVAEQALMASRARRDNSQPNTLRELSIALDKIGHVSRDLGNLEVARAAFQESLAICRQLRSTLGDAPQTLLNLSTSLNDLGRVYQDLGDFEAARLAYAEMLAINRQARAVLGDAPIALQALSISFDNIGQLARERGDLEVARMAVSESLALRRNLRSALGDNSQILRSLSISLDNVGLVARALGDMDAARAAYEESLALSRQLRVAHGEEPVVLEDIARGLGHLGWLQRDLGDLAASRAVYREGADLAARLVALRPEHPGYRKLLASFNADIAKLNSTVSIAP
ncbi:MAG: tetratricopeptide repeat protein [Pseudomonadota bacterium]|nr:tetratricopeptide repeat protein [Pseudomonadota bacterium]